MSIGALYRFYPDKQSIFDALAVRHVAQFRELLEYAVMQPLERDLKADVPKFNPPKFLEDVIDTYVRYLDQNPDFRALALGQLISTGTKAKEASPISGLPSVLKKFLLERVRIPNTRELNLTVSVVSEAGERLIAFAYEQESREARELIIREMKRMLTGYLFVSG
jgi:AcrR family transcriptional regulator